MNRLDYKTTEEIRTEPSMLIKTDEGGSKRSGSSILFRSAYRTTSSSIHPRWLILVYLTSMHCYWEVSG